MVLTHSKGVSAYSNQICPIRTLLSLYLLPCPCCLQSQVWRSTPTPSKSRASHAHPQHQHCPCTPGPWLLVARPPAGLLLLPGCLETCAKLLQIWQTNSSKDLLSWSSVNDVTADGARRDLPRAARVEGMSTAQGPTIHCHSGQSRHCNSS